MARTTLPMTDLTYRAPSTEVRESPIHGRGLFARNAIAKGEIVAVKGGHVLTGPEWRALEPTLGSAEIQIAEDLFIAPVDRDERHGCMLYVNHCCDPNCEPQIIRGRVFIVAIRAIRPGDELGFEYNIGREDDDPPNVDDIYACRCGARQCRGTILWPPRLPKKAAHARPA